MMLAQKTSWCFSLFVIEKGMEYEGILLSAGPLDNVLQNKEN